MAFIKWINRLSKSYHVSKNKTKSTLKKNGSQCLIERIIKRIFDAFCKCNLRSALRQTQRNQEDTKLLSSNSCSSVSDVFLFFICRCSPKDKLCQKFQPGYKYKQFHREMYGVCTEIKTNKKETCLTMIDHSCNVQPE